MEKRLREVLKNNGENYILPFFWQHGESKELLEEGMEKIHASGIGAVCVESRPHPEFLGEKWWRDMDVIMAKAKKLGMRVWVLDDAHFPSGYCNGKVAETIAESTDTKVCTFETCHNLTREDFEKGETYLTLMERNVETLKEALN